jgi:UDP:flavonoid glycosyltransferase YjiC (YdhE family)
VADITFGGILFVKEKMNIPVIGVDIIPLTETSKDLPPAGLGMLPSKSFFGRRKQDILRFMADRVMFAKSNKVLKDTLAQHGIQAKGSNVFDVNIKNSTVVLQSGTPGFEYERSDLSSHIVYVGPLLPYKQQAAGATWFDERLRTYQKVVVLTQGTVEKDVEKLMVPTFEALKGSDVLVIATTGGSKTAELKSRFPENNIIIEDFIAFDDIMPYADVYVTNGGYGGVLLSIQNELPMVVAGVHEGKNEICARVGYFKLGVNLKTEKPEPKQLRAAINEVINNTTYRTNVKKLNEEFRTYDTPRLCEEQVALLLNKRSRVTGTAIRQGAPIY